MIRFPPVHLPRRPWIGVGPGLTRAARYGGGMVLIAALLSILLFALDPLAKRYEGTPLRQPWEVQTRTAGAAELRAPIVPPWFSWGYYAAFWQSRLEGDVDYSIVLSPSLYMRTIGTLVKEGARRRANTLLLLSAALALAAAGGTALGLLLRAWRRRLRWRTGFALLELLSHFPMVSLTILTLLVMVKGLGIRPDWRRLAGAGWIDVGEILIFPAAVLAIPLLPRIARFWIDLALEGARARPLAWALHQGREALRALADAMLIALGWIAVVEVGFVYPGLAEWAIKAIFDVRVAQVWMLLLTLLGFAAVVLGGRAALYQPTAGQVQSPLGAAAFETLATLAPQARGPASASLRRAGEASPSRRVREDDSAIVPQRKAPRLAGLERDPPPETLAAPADGWFRWLAERDGLVIGGYLLIAVVALLAFAGFFPGMSVEDVKALQPFRPASADFPLGTDVVGRNVWRLLIEGGRIYLAVAVACAAAALALAWALGALAGYLRVLAGPLRGSAALLSVYPGVWWAMWVVLVTGRGLPYMAIGLFLACLPALLAQFAPPEEGGPSPAWWRARGRTRGLLLGGLLLVTAAESFLILAHLAYLSVGERYPGPEWGATLRDMFARPHPDWVLVVTPALALLAIALALFLPGRVILDQIDRRSWEKAPGGNASA